MRMFVTGGTGFIGGRVVRRLLERGDEVRALARSAERGAGLTGDGAEVVLGTLADRDVIREAIAGCDAVVHGAAMYEVGIPESEHRAMYEANVVGTENVLRAALEARIPKVVYVSTVVVFGNTHGEVVDETHQHPGESFTSYYERTKYEAHRVARSLIDEGVAAVIVQPGGVYGPGDHSAIGKQMDDFVRGRLPALAFPEAGFNLVHVDDVAAGVILALDRGEAGEAYVLGGENTTMRELFARLGEVVGRRPPRLAFPTPVLRLLAPAGPLLGRLMGQPPNLRELIASADGVTFWARDDKARAELGYAPRGLEQGLRDTFSVEAKLAAGGAGQ